MKDRDVLIVLALIAVLWYLSRRQAAAAAAPVGTVTTSETYLLPDGRTVSPGTPGVELAFWYSILNLGKV